MFEKELLKYKDRLDVIFPHHPLKTISSKTLLLDMSLVIYKIAPLALHM